MRSSPAAINAVPCDFPGALDCFESQSTLISFLIEPEDV